MPLTNKKIIEATKAGNIQAVEAYLNEDNKISPIKKINETDSDGFTLLHHTAAHDQDKLLEFLLSQNADVNISSKNSRTPLHLAAKSNSTKSMALLIDNGTNINVKSRRGLTPLHSAIKKGHIEAVQLLLDKKADVNARTYHSPNNDSYAPMHMVCNAKLSRDVRIKIAGMLLANSNINLDVMWADCNNINQPTCLSMFAIARGAVEIAEMIDEKKRQEKLQQTDAYKRIAELEERVRHLERKVHKLKAEKVTTEKNADANTLFGLKPKMA